MTLNPTDICDLLTLCDEALQKLRQYDVNGKYDNLVRILQQITSPLIDGNELTPEIRGAVPAKDLSQLKEAIFLLRRSDFFVRGRSVNTFSSPINAIRTALNTLKNNYQTQIQTIPRKVFYSWQASLPNVDNRGLIFDCLKKAVLKLNAEIEQPDREPIQLDHDTKDEPGSPKIFEVIIEKINQSGIFVADVSLVANNQSNSNVMVELGYALSKLGNKRIIMVFNEAYGETRMAPFDLGFNRMITYNYKNTSNNSDKTKQKEILTSKLCSALKTILKDDVTE